MNLIETIKPLEKKRDQFLAIAGQMDSLIRKLQDMCPHIQTQHMGQTHGASLEQCLHCNKVLRS
jgi:regulator of replication initiation timing